MPKLTATDVSRSFSAVLNRVRAGEEFEITRSGATVAVMGPPKHRLASAERFRECLASAPPVDDDFARDVLEIRASVGAPESPWPS